MNNNSVENSTRDFYGSPRLELGVSILEYRVQPVVITIGIVGNLLNLMVLFRRLRQRGRGSTGTLFTRLITTAAELIYCLAWQSCGFLCFVADDKCDHAVSDFAV